MFRKLLLFAEGTLCETILCYHLFHFHVKCPISHTVCCAQGEVTLSTSTKAAIKLLESKKLSFAILPWQPGAKTSTKLAPKKRGR